MNFIEQEVINLIAYFIIYSFFGWLMETVLKSAEQKKFVNSGFITGPFCPIYGVGAIIMYLFLDRFKTNYFILFLVSFFVLSIWEYIVGFLLEKLFKTKYWDYSNSKFNIQGRVCLMNSLAWGILGVIFTTIMHPTISNLISKVPNNILLYADIMIGAYIAIDVILSSIKVTNINIKLNIFTEISNNIEEKLKELKSLSEKAEQKFKIEPIKNLINEMKEKQIELKKKLYKQTERLRKAFPTMKSEEITKFLSEKIDNIKNDKKK